MTLSTKNTNQVNNDEQNKYLIKSFNLTVFIYSYLISYF